MDRSGHFTFPTHNMEAALSSTMLTLKGTLPPTSFDKRAARCSGMAKNSKEWALGVEEGRQGKFQLRRGRAPKQDLECQLPPRHTMLVRGPRAPSYPPESKPQPQLYLEPQAAHTAGPSSSG